MGLNPKRKSIPALKVRQWLADWEEIHWAPKERRAEPQHWFYQFSLTAAELKSLSGIYPRKTKGRKKASQDLGIQRSHDSERSNEISKFVKYGYPWSNLSETKRNSGEFQDLRQPGWLPTAIVVNILTSEDERLGKHVSASDLIKIMDGKNGSAELLLPERVANWKPKTIPPIEVIDGQHRLWAFEDGQYEGDYELPVVAFVGLDLSWQAYLFYTINIKPKKINASLAFDLYPLLRTEQWLTKFEGHAIYRETRAQELVDLLWAHPESPWHHRINMLGERVGKGLMVTQASWVRSLLASFIKSWEGHRIPIGGLFGATVGEHKTVLPWSRTEQAAFLILVGQTIQKEIDSMSKLWMQSLRKQQDTEDTANDRDPAFFGPNNLLNNDQGVRVILQVTNDLCFIRADELRLYNWGGRQQEENSDEENINVGIGLLKKSKEIYSYLRQLSGALASYDWRTSSGPDLTEEARTRKAAFRGSGGYKELRRDVLRHVATRTKGTIAQAANEVIERLGY